MKLTKSLILTCTVLACTVLAGPNKRLPIHGEWSTENPVQFVTDLELRQDRPYLIQNNTGQTITVMLVEWEWDAILGDYGRTPLEYFPLLAGESRQFEAPWNLSSDQYSMDLYLRGMEGAKLNGRNGVGLEEMPEFITDYQP